MPLPSRRPGLCVGGAPGRHRGPRRGQGAPDPSEKPIRSRPLAQHVVGGASASERGEDRGASARPGAASPHAQPHLVCHSAPSLARSLRAALCFSSSRSFSWLARSRAGAELGKGPGRTARPLVPLCWGPRGGVATGKPSPARGPVRSGPQRASPAGAVPPAKLATPPRPAGSPRRPAVAPRGCRCPDPGRCVREAGCPPRAAPPLRPAQHVRLWLLTSTAPTSETRLGAAPRTEASGRDGAGLREGWPATA